MSYNPGLLFYKHYYRDIQFGNDSEQVQNRNQRHFEDRHQTLLNTPFSPELSERTLPPGALTFPLKTTYPGLMIGVGYAHGSGLKGEIKSGFYFDHTSGLPVIPGSSVKGVLRSAFPVLYYERAALSRNDEDKLFWNQMGDNRKQFILGLLNALAFETENTDDYVLRLEREIFEGLCGIDRENKDHHFRMSDRDIFYDAVIIGTQDRKIFESDFITPHLKPLKNPIPVQLLKVKPGVTFEFRFGLKPDYAADSEAGVIRANRLLTPQQRQELFRQILMFLGAGAKTNTGFGHFEPHNRVQFVTTEADSVVVPPPPVQTEPENYMGEIKKGKTLQAKVLEKGSKKWVKIIVEGVELKVEMSGNCPEVGVVCQVVFSDVTKSTKIIKMVSYDGPLKK